MPQRGADPIPSPGPTLRPPAARPLPCPASGSERTKEDAALRAGFLSYGVLQGVQLWMPPLITQIAGKTGCVQRHACLSAAPRQSPGLPVAWRSGKLA